MVSPTCFVNVEIVFVVHPVVVLSIVVYLYALLAFFLHFIMFLFDDEMRTLTAKDKSE